MKKFITLILALVIILSTSVSAFAFSKMPFTSNIDSVKYAILEAMYGDGYLDWPLIADPTLGMLEWAGADLVEISMENLDNLIYRANARGLTTTKYEYKSGYYCAVIERKLFYPNNTGDKYYTWGNSDGYAYIAKGTPSQSQYSVVAIAGVSNYYLTNRPAGTSGNGYLGDLYLTYDNWLNIQSTLNNLTGDKSYYTYGHSINGEFRYYLANRPSTTTYYVCNSSGQLFYTIKDTGSSEDTGGGSTFDPTEVITAINSVYDAINSQGSRLANGLSQLTITANTISDILNLHMNNVVDGFGDIQNSLSTLNSYFTDLSGLFPVQETITLLGSDTRVAWDSADRITNVTAAGFNGDLIVKERPGDLVDESGYEKVTINETEYSLYNDTNGYRRIKANNEYEGTGSPIPDNALFYFPFDNTLSSSVGTASFTVSGGSAAYGTGVNGNAFRFSGSDYLTSSNIPFSSASADSFTVSYWVNIPSRPANSSFYSVLFGSGSFNIGFLRVSISAGGTLFYQFYNDSGDFYPVSSSYGTHVIPTNSWCQVGVAYNGTTAYCFLNGELDTSLSFDFFGISSSTLLIGDSSSFSGSPSSYFPSGSMVDELIWVNGECLWTSSFDPNKEAVFGGIARDYFLPCDDQSITLNFFDLESEQVTNHQWNMYSLVSDGRLPDGYTELEYIQSSGTQKIDMGTSVPHSTARVVVEFSPVDTRTDNVLTGHAANTWSWATNLSFVLNNRLWVSNTGVGVSDINVGTFYTFDYTSTTASINGVSQSLNSQSFTDGYNDTLFYSSTKYGAHKVKSYKLYNGSTLVRDLVPCKNPSNAVGMYDLVTNSFFGNSGTGSFTAGPVVTYGSSMGQLLGVVSSTNANAYPNDGIQGDFYYKYIGSVTDYPSFSQTLSPTDVNGNAITMGRLDDDFSEIYMNITTMQWYCHDPQTQTEILLSSANQQIMNDTIYTQQNYTILPADQITADALQNLLPVDSPVYLDMPEGAKLTITYDHYTGWFRMMYILMDKQTKLLSDLDIVSETIINVENTVIDITNNNPAYNVFYITKTDGTTESVGDAAKDAAVFVGDVLSMFYRLVFDDALDNAGVIQDFEDVLTTTNTGVNVW